VGPAPIVGTDDLPGPWSGRITGIAVDPSVDADTIYIAAAGGGVWKTTHAQDCVDTPPPGCWTPLTDDVTTIFPLDRRTLFMGAITVAPDPTDPENPDRRFVYAGTGEANNHPDTYYGRGVLISRNSGTSWTLSTGTGTDGTLNNFDRRTISKIVVDPMNPRSVYVDVAGPGTNGLTGNTGIWHSVNAGDTWTNTTTAISTTANYSDLVIDPMDPLHQTLYTAVWNAGAASGLYITTDGGGSWTQIMDPMLPRGPSVGRTALAMAPTPYLFRSVLYASIANPSTGGLFAMMRGTTTTMGMTTWTNITASLGVDADYLGGQGNYDTAIVVDPHDQDAVFVAGQTKVLRTLNGTAAMPTWQDITVAGSSPHEDHHALVFAPVPKFEQETLLLDGNDGGIWGLRNPHAVGMPPPGPWVDLNRNLQITQFVGIATHPTDPKIIYGGSQDNGTEVFRCPEDPLRICALDPDAPFLEWKLKDGNDGGWVRVTQDASFVFHEYGGSGSSPSPLLRSGDGGDTWFDITTGLSGPSQGYAPYVVDPVNSTRLLYGTNRVFESLNDGITWAPISTPGVGGWTDSGPIDTVALSPTNSDTIYASAGGHVYVTFDHGLNWMRRDAPRTDAIAQIVVNPFDDQIAYAVSPCFDLVGTCLFGGTVTGTGHVFMTTNGGMNWNDISGPGSGFPDLPTWSFVVDPGRGGGDAEYYAGTDNGVYRGGFIPALGRITWDRLPDRLPRAQVHDLEWNANLGLLTAGTYGRGAWQIPISRGYLGPDRFGYSGTIAPFQYYQNFGQPDTFTILSATGFGANSVDLGRNVFTFYGTRYTGDNRLFASASGQITFGLADPSLCDDFTHAGEPAIAVLCGPWTKHSPDPMHPPPMVLGRFDGPHGDGTYDRLIIEWFNVYHYLLDPYRPQIEDVRFEAVLDLNTYPSSGRICFNYWDLRQSGIIDDRQTEGFFTEGRMATVGIKAGGLPGPYRLLVSYNNLSTFVGTQQSLCISSPPPPGSPSGDGPDRNLGEEVMALLAAPASAPPSPVPIPPAHLATAPAGGAAPPAEVTCLDHLFAVTDGQDHGFALRRSTLGPADGEDSWQAAVVETNHLLWDAIYSPLYQAR
jgi:photosystem II stability/assembly factor-like uncharacterized protein